MDLHRNGRVHELSHQSLPILLAPSRAPGGSFKDITVNLRSTDGGELVGLMKIADSS